MCTEWSYERQTVLGRGAYGIVYLGHLNRVGPVAVKRIARTEFAAAATEQQSREEAAMAQLDHPNVLKLHYVAVDDSFKYYFLELCQATIGDYYTNKYTGPMPDRVDSMLQMVSGLSYIHFKGFVHRDIKADNVLISSPTNRVQLKISDFGLSKEATASGSFSLTSGVKGTRLYYAAELLRLEDEQGNEGEPHNNVINIRGNVSSDIFALGCLFYGLVTKGKHPFSDGRGRFFIPENIIKGRFNLDDTDELAKGDKWVRPIIEGMIKTDPTQRSTLDEIETMLLNRLLAINKK